MANQMYMTIHGTRQGKFYGKNVSSKHIGKIPIISFSSDTQSPRDMNTGMATGKRHGGGVKVLKIRDSSSPQLFRAMTTNETLKSVVFEFFETAPDGSEYLSETITLSDVLVGSVRDNLSGRSKGSEGGISEEVVFSYTKISAVGVPRAGFSDAWNE